MAFQDPNSNRKNEVAEQKDAVIDVTDYSGKFYQFVYKKITIMEMNKMCYF